MLEYKKRGYCVDGERLPEEWSINCPPWKWLSEGKLQHRELTSFHNFHKHYKALTCPEALMDFDFDVRCIYFYCTAVVNYILLPPPEPYTVLVQLVFQSPPEW